MNDIDTMSSTIAKLVCVSMLSLRKISDDPVIRDVIKTKHKKEPPKSISTIRKIVLDHAAEAKAMVASELKKKDVKRKGHFHYG